MNILENSARISIKKLDSTIKTNLFLLVLGMEPRALLLLRLGKKKKAHIPQASAFSSQRKEVSSLSQSDPGSHLACHLAPASAALLSVIAMLGLFLLLYLSNDVDPRPQGQQLLFCIGWP